MTENIGKGVERLEVCAFEGKGRSFIMPYRGNRRAQGTSSPRLFSRIGPLSAVVGDGSINTCICTAPMVEFTGMSFT